MDALPETLTEMNEFFIVHTIYRYMKKTVPLDEHVIVKKLTKLPPGIYKFVCKLANLAYEGLQKNQLVFSYDKIKVFCPQIVKTINGFGLLQAVQHYVQRGAGKTTSFNFLHFTMQEYLAAFHVSTLPDKTQLSLMKESFWNGQLNFMWMMYVGIVGIEHEAIVSFLSTYDASEHIRNKSRGATLAMTPLSFNLTEQTAMTSNQFSNIDTGTNNPPDNTYVPDLMPPPPVCSSNNLLQIGTYNPPGNTYVPDLMPPPPVFSSSNMLQTGTNNLCTNIDTPYLMPPPLEHIKNMLQTNEVPNDPLAITNILLSSPLSLPSEIRSTDTPWPEDIDMLDHLSRDIQRDKRKCLHLFQCYMEAKSNEIPETISSIFSGGVIELTDITLLPHHISSLIFFISSSTQQWRSLNLRNCNLRSSGMNALLEHIIKNEEKMSTLEYVDLSGNHSSPWGVYCVIIRHCCVNSVTLCGDDGMEEYVKEITDSLEISTMLQCLKLCHINYTGANCIAKIIQSNTTLRKLDLSQNDISDNGAVTVINHLKNIKELDMSHNNITSKGMNHLMESAKNISTLAIDYVDLSGNHSSPWGVYCVIIRHCCVNSLTLCGDYGIEEYVKEINDSLEANRKLESLTLCGIGRFGLELIKEILINNSTLSEVNLSWMKIGSEGAKKNMLVQTKIPLNSLNYGEVVSSHNRVVGINILYDEQSDKSAHLSTNNDDALAIMAFGLYIYITVMKCKVIFPELSDVGAIRRSNNRLLDLLLSSQQSRYIIKLARSESCNLSGKMISNDKILLLSLILYNNIGVKKLNILRTGLSDIGALAISNSLENNTTLQELNLCNKGKAIHENYTLKKLNFSLNKISANGAAAIISNATVSLGELMLSHNKITDVLPIARSIEVCRAVRVLDISQNNITKAEILLFCDSLKSNTSLLVLTISLPENNSVIYINAMGSTCNMANKAMGDDGAQIVSALLHNNTNVTTLDVSRNQIMEDGIIAIVDYLKNNTILQEMNMSFNKINFEGTKKIAEVIQVNITLQKLDISYCSIPDDGALVISESYKNSKTLEQLILSWNNDQVTINTTIAIWNLSNKNIGNTGALIVSNLLYSNTVVKQLDISYNNISEDGALALSCGLTNNSSLEELNMSGNDINQKAVEVLLNSSILNMHFHLLM